MCDSITCIQLQYKFMGVTSANHLPPARIHHSRSLNTRTHCHRAIFNSFVTNINKLASVPTHTPAIIVNNFATVSVVEFRRFYANECVHTCICSVEEKKWNQIEIHFYCYRNFRWRTRDWREIFRDGLVIVPQKVSSARQFGAYALNSVEESAHRAHCKSSRALKT